MRILIEVLLVGLLSYTCTMLPTRTTNTYYISPSLFYPFALEVLKLLLLLYIKLSGNSRLFLLFTLVSRVVL